MGVRPNCADTRQNAAHDLPTKFPRIAVNATKRGFPGKRRTPFDNVIFNNIAVMILLQTATTPHREKRNM
jgi:hypothetical protein